MRDLKFAVPTVAMLLIFLMQCSCAHAAAGCGSMDAVSKLIQEAKVANQSSNLWKSGEWSTWDKKIQLALKESGFKGDVAKVTKSLRRKLGRGLSDQLAAAPAEAAVEVRTAEAAMPVSRTNPVFPLEKAARKSLEAFQRSNPTVYKNYLRWENLVEEKGLTEVRKIPGYHDEPLEQLSRVGQHSVRLNKGYRVFYRIDEATKKITIVDVNLHDY